MIIPFRTLVFFLSQWDVRNIIKLKLKQASKEFQKEFHYEKRRARLAKNFFTCASQFRKVRGDLILLQNGFHELKIALSD